MTRILLFAFIALLSINNSYSQLPDGSVAPDFNLVDLNGVSHNLYSVLDEGYTVFLDFSAVWCGPCWNYHSGGTLENLYENHGPSSDPNVSANTTDDIMVFMIEGDGNSEDCLNGINCSSSQGDWVTGTNYPIICTDGTYNNTAVSSDYSIAYWPTIYMVCPDRLISEVGQPSDPYSLVNVCPSAATYWHDVRTFDYTADTLTCEGDITPQIMIQNYGIASLTSLNINVSVNGSLVSSTPWSGNLSTYATDNVTLPVLNSLANNDAVSITTSLPNGVVDADPSNNTAVSFNVTMATQNTATNVTVAIVTDSYGSETTWNIKNSTGQTLASGGPYNDLPSAGTTVQTPVSVTLDQNECHTFTIYDSYGDGINNPQYGAGSFTVTDASGTVLASGGVFEDVVSDAWKTSSGGVIFGCTDPLAVNYDLTATIDNGSCSYPNSSNYIWDIVSNSSDHTTLETALLACGLDVILSDSAEVLTLFAPTDAAFNLLPAGAVAALLADIVQFTEILEHHVVNASVMSSMLSNNQVITTLNGDVLVTINSTGVFIDNAQVTIADIIADNGVVHVIDAILLPPPSPDVYGCTDILAYNYDPNATIDDGSCQYISSCIPDPQYTYPGIYPDSITGLANSYVGQPYNEVFTVIVGTDTVSEIFPGALVPVTIDSVVLTAISGLPAGFSYDCNPASCSFPAGSTGCVSIYSTQNPVGSIAGSYPLLIETTTYSSDVPLIGNMSQNDITDDYNIEILGPLIIYGCTNPIAINYDPDATVDDGSCLYSNGMCSDLFFSEYVEGTNQNKAIEIFNPTNSFIDLSSYQVERYSNGNTNNSAGGVTSLTGLLAPGDVFVLTSGETDTASVWGYIDPILFSLGNMAEPAGSYPTPMHMNGDDAMVLTKNGVILDVIGQIGYDPGTAWTDLNGVWWTANHTLIRKSSVMSGDNNGLDWFDPTLEWDSLTVDDWTNLGSHTCNCFSSAITYGCTDTAACNYDFNANTDNGSCTYISNPVINMTIGSWQWEFNDCFGSSLGLYELIFYSDNTVNIVNISDTTQDPFLYDWSLCDDNLLVYNSSFEDYLYLTYSLNLFEGSQDNGLCFTLSPITNIYSGCTDPIADNYNPAATLDNGSCVYSNSSPPIWCDDFSDPGNWIIEHDPTSCSLDFQIGVNSCQGSYPIDDILSTTASNGYALIDSDFYGGANGGTEVEDCWLTTANPIDLNGYPYVAVEFETQYKVWQSCEPYIVVGIGDGLGNVTWPDLDPFTDISSMNNVFKIFPDWNVGDATTNPQLMTVNISSALAGLTSTELSDIYIRFNWTGTWGYGWYIDDVCISEIPDNQVSIQDEVYGGWWINYQNTLGIGQDYTYNPMSQATANPFAFESVIKNTGLAPQNVTMYTNVSGPSTSLHSSSTIYLPSIEQDTFSAFPLFTPPVNGVYTIDMWGVGDSAGAGITFTNTAITTKTTEVTDYIYGKDNNSYESSWRLSRTVGNSTANSPGGFEVGADYDIYADADLYSVDVFIADYSVPGTNVYVALYEVDLIDPNMEPIMWDISENYTLQVGDAGTWINIPFISPILLNSGMRYCITIGGYMHPTDSAGVGVSGNGDASFDRLFDKDDHYQNGSPSWYTIGDIPMLRMNFGPTLYGCTDPVADNYDPIAIVDDGSCEYCSSLTAVVSNANNVSCYGDCDGSASIIAVGGTPPYIYSWNTNASQPTPTANGLCAGYYWCEVTDTLGCSQTVGVFITEPAEPLNTTLSLQDVSYVNGNDGFAIANPNDGTAPYSFIWIDESGNAINNSSSVSNLTSGVYNLLVTDANGCVDNIDFQISQPCTSTLTSITPSQGSSGQSFSLTISGNGVEFNNWSGTGVSDFRFSQWSGTNMFYGYSSFANSSDLFGAVSVPECQPSGMYDLEVWDYGCNQWVELEDAFEVESNEEITSITPSQGSSGQSFSLTISGNGVEFNNWSGTGVSDFRFSQWSGTNMFYGYSSFANSSDLYGSVNVPECQSPGMYDLEVWDYGCNQWVELEDAFEVQSNEETTTITECYSYVWPVNGNIYSISGTYTQVSTDSVGCTQTEILLLTINNSTSNTTSITACDFYFWPIDGNTYTTSGTYTDVSANTDGCDHMETLNLTINSSTSNTTILTECDSYIWPIDGNTYTTSGTYTNVNTNAAGCTEIETLELTINNSTSNTTSITACDSYTWSNGNTYTTSGTYTDVSTNAAGCTEIETLVLTINNSTSSTNSITACDSYTWLNGNTYTTSGTYTNANYNSAGCIDTDTLELTINNSTSNTTSITACDSYTWSNGTTYTTSGIYTDVTINAVGCTETETLDLTIINSTSNIEVLTECVSYTWPVNGITYTASGIYTDVGTNAAGCTETETLDLTIINSTSNVDSLTECVSYTWPVNGITYTASGTYTDVSTNAAGCTETEILVLTINNSTSNSTSIIACDSYVWSVNGITYNTSGTYTDVSINAAGCTETETLVLTINNSTSNSTSITVCDSYTWSNGSTYTTSGTYTDVSVNASGCTHTETLVLTVNHSTSSSSDLSVCDSFSWFGQLYTVSGSYTYTALSSSGCDSVVTLNLTVNNTYNITNTVTICSGESIVVGSNTYNQTGTYTDLFTTSNGCDSIIITQLTIYSDIVSIITQNGNDILSNVGGGSAPYLYEWNTGETTSQITPNMNGDYWLIITDVNGCISDTSYFTVTWVSTSIEYLNIDKLNIYPNPSRDIFNIEFTSLVRQELEVRVINSIGEVVYVDNISNHIGEYINTISLEKNSKGIYFLEIQTNDGIVNKKLIIQ